MNILTDVKVLRVCESSHAEDNQDLAAFPNPFAIIFLLSLMYKVACTQTWKTMFYYFAQNSHIIIIWPKKGPLYKIIRREIKKVTSCLTSREQLSYEICDPSVFHKIITRSDIC